MLAYRLVPPDRGPISTLADSLLDRVMRSDLLRDYQKYLHRNYRSECLEIYRHLGDWLLGANDFDIQERYVEIQNDWRANGCSAQPSDPGPSSRPKENL